MVSLNTGTIQMQDEILSLQRRLVIVNVGSTEVLIKILFLRAVVISLQH